MGLGGKPGRLGTKGIADCHCRGGDLCRAESSGDLGINWGFSMVGAGSCEAN